MRSRGASTPQRRTPDPYPGTPQTEDAVRAALKWLAHHQGPDGGWGAETFVNQCTGGRCSGTGDSSYDAGVTGLAVLAFLGAGYIPMSKDEFPDPVDPKRTLKFGETVKNKVNAADGVVGALPETSSAGGGGS